jgi:hypothetical protein
MRMSILPPATKRHSTWKRFLSWFGIQRCADAALRESPQEWGSHTAVDSTPDLGATVDLEKMVDHVLVDRMQVALELSYSGKAKYLYAVPVHEKRNGTSIWYGRVYLFALEQPGATKKVYAWFQDAADGPKRFHAVFREGPVDSPATAVRVALGLDT